MYFHRFINEWKLNWIHQFFQWFFSFFFWFGHCWCLATSVIQKYQWMKRKIFHSFHLKSKLNLVYLLLLIPLPSFAVYLLWVMILDHDYYHHQKNFFFHSFFFSPFFRVLALFSYIYSYFGLCVCVCVCGSKYCLCLCVCVCENETVPFLFSFLFCFVMNFNDGDDDFVELVVKKQHLKLCEKWREKKTPSSSSCYYCKWMNFWYYFFSWEKQFNIYSLIMGGQKTTTTITTFDDGNFFRKKMKPLNNQ